MSIQGDTRIAIVHDELTRRGGAEVVLEDVIRTFPESDIYSLYAGTPRIVVDDRGYNVKTSFLQKMPTFMRRHPSRLLPLLPQAAEQFDLSSYDLVISSSSGFAKAVITRAHVPHLSYCHTPTRYLWDSTHGVVRDAGPIKGIPGRLALHALRLADFAAAQRVNSFLANSEYTKRRIRHYYRLDSEVVYPPIDTTFYTPTSDLEKRTYFLCTGRLSRTKNLEQAIHVCEKLNLALVIVGVGPERARLEKIAGKHTRFVGRVSDKGLRRYYRGARALIQPGIEDFGMASAEALACGTPVIAVNQGGAREIVNNQITGMMYDEAREESLAEGLRQFLIAERLFRKEILQQSVLKFSRHQFKEIIMRKAEAAIASRADKSPVQYLNY